MEEASCTGQIKVLQERIAGLEQSQRDYQQIALALQKANLFNQVLLDTIPFGMDIVDTKGNILFMNGKLESIFGRQAIGKKCWHLYRDDKTQCRDCPLIQGLKPGETASLVTDGCLGGKSMMITHTAMMYGDQMAVLEIFQDITELKKIERELRQANEKLERLNRLKSQFVADVSHESKNPLTITQGALDIVLEEIAGKINPRQKEMLELAKNAIERLTRLVTDLLDLSAIDSGRVELRREKIDIAELVHELLAEFQLRVSRKRQILKKDLSDTLGVLWGDRDRLAAVIMNLLSNAIKYTPEQGSIVVKIEGDEKEIRFEIADTGPGIPKEYREKIFDRYERVKAEKQEGTGLGLAIAKEIVELHKGKIWVESEPGEGSRFIFVLPRDLRE